MIQESPIQPHACCPRYFEEGPHQRGLQRMLQRWVVPQQNTARFIQEVAKFKDFIHCNSFSYDFNLRILREVLEARSVPMSNFNFVGTLHHLANTVPRPFKFAWNYIGRSWLEIDPTQHRIMEVEPSTCSDSPSSPPDPAHIDLRNGIVE